MRSAFALLAATAAVVAALVAPAPQAAAAEPVERLSIERLAGSDRYATSVAISRETPATGGIVYLASGATFADALAAGPVAASEDAHLLLTQPDALPDVVRDRIRELAPSEVVLVGGGASIRDVVRAQVAAAVPGARLTRVGGVDRVATSLLLLDRLASRTPVAEVWIVSGHRFPDALVAASVAGANRGAIVLDHHGGTDQDARGWAARVAPSISGLPVTIAGGTASVSTLDASLIASSARSVERLSGRDRFETAIRINEARPTADASERLLLATGVNFPDALAGAVLASATGSPLYLTHRTCDTSVTTAIRAAADARGVASVIGLGGRAVVTDDALALEACRTFTPAQQAIGATYGTFETERYEGMGNAHIRVDTDAARYALIEVDILHEGASAVARYDSFDRYDGELFRGSVSGSQSEVVATGYSMPYDSIAIDIDTEGPWRLRVLDLRHLPELPASASGVGQQV